MIAVAGNRRVIHDRIFLVQPHSRQNGAAVRGGIIERGLGTAS